MREWQSQTHVKWYCRYHVVIVPKYRRKSMFGAIRREVGEIFKDLCRRLGLEVGGGHVLGDHVHMRLAIPPKYSVANTVGLDEAMIREYIRTQEEHEKKEEQIQLDY